MQRVVALAVLCVLFIRVSIGQNDSIPQNTRKKKIVLASTSGALIVGSLVYLNQAWYQEYSTGKFHFFNDNREWLQMDKAGHTFTTYQVGRLMMGAFKNAGFNRPQQLWIGGLSGFAYMTAIEVMDGYSDGWGFSTGDMVANTFGSAIAIAQQAGWNEQRIQLKFSYAKSGLAKYNPSLLGDSFSTQLLKDYNGQTYWVSANPTSFIKKKNRFPKWLNVAFGYSAYGMLGGHANNFVVTDEEGRVLNFERQRRFYLSVDVDLTRIKTRSKFLKGLFSVVNMVKIPAPAVQFSNSGLKFYYLYQ